MEVLRKTFFIFFSFANFFLAQHVEKKNIHIALKSVISIFQLIEFFLGKFIGFECAMGRK